MPRQAPRKPQLERMKGLGTRQRKRKTNRKARMIRITDGMFVRAANDQTILPMIKPMFEM